MGDNSIVVQEDSNSDEDFVDEVDGSTLASRLTKVLTSPAGVFSDTKFKEMKAFLKKIKSKKPLAQPQVVADTAAAVPDKLSFEFSFYKSAYDVRPDGPGLAMIINNEHFGCKWHASRDGTQNDEVNLDREFQKCLGIEDVFFARDLTKDEMNAAVREVAKMATLNNYSYLIFVILSHGSKGEIIHSTDACSADASLCNSDKMRCYKNSRCCNYDHYKHTKHELDLLKLIKPLKECKALLNKPKWFIIQACRGDNLDEGQAGVKGGSATPPSVDPWVGVKTPVEADVLMTYASPPGYYAIRATSEKPYPGGYMIQTLCRCLQWLTEEQAKGRKVEIQRLMVELNARCSSIETPVKAPVGGKDVVKNVTIMPCITHTLRREFYPRPMTSSLTFPAGDQ